jgi:3-hydroxybutyryl-CoA dehydrogenase
MSVQRVGVIGCGAMGGGFAEVCALAGLPVQVVVRDADAVRRGRERLTGSLERLVRKEKISPADRDGAIARITFSEELKDLRGCQFILESVTEDLAVKQRLFEQLDAVVTEPGAVLASNTSSIPIMKLAMVTGDPGRVVGVHLFNPVPVMSLVEVTPSLRTGKQTLDATRSFVTDVLGKQVVLSTDRPGFVVNSLLIPYLISAVRMLESGVASAADIDRAMVLGCGHPLGPLGLIDLIGLDIIASVGQSMYEELKDPQYAPPTLLLRMIEGGFLGRKSGRGFHDYSPAAQKAG